MITFTKPEEITGLIVAATTALGVLGRLLYGRLWGKGSLVKEVVVTAEVETPEKEKPGMTAGDFYKELKGYITRDECRGKHAGVEAQQTTMCGKVDVVLGIVKSAQELNMQQHKEVIDQISECRKLIIGQISKGQ